MPIRLSQADAPARPLMIRHILDSALATSSTQEIVYRDYHRQTYAQLGDDVHRMAKMLAALGVEEGTTVAIMDWDSHRYLQAYFAIPMMGAILQTINVRLAPEQIAFCLQSSGATVLIYHHDFSLIIDNIGSSLTQLKARVVISDNATTPLPVGTPVLESLFAKSTGPYAFRDFDENAIATTFHTTGTTGNPKAVSFSHRQLVLHTLALTATLGLQPPGEGFGRLSTYMPLTPMFHVHAWGMPYVATMIGAKQVYPGRYDPGALVQLARTENVSFSHCVPTVLQMILKALAESGASLSSPWVMMIGGSPLTEKLRSECESVGITALSGYGMSETGPAIAISRSTGRLDEDHRLRRAGFTLPLVEAMIVDQDMSVLPRDGKTSGELVLRAPWLTRDYSNDSAASVALWRGGWMHTLDVAQIDTDGSIDIVDRLKDVIKTGGEWISSAQIEDVLQQNALVKEAAVIGVPDEKWIERPSAFVVANEDLSPEDMHARLTAHLLTYVQSGIISRYALPDTVFQIETLPKTSVGKVDKKELRRLWDISRTKPTGLP